MPSQPSNQDHIIGYLKDKFAHWVHRVGENWLEGQIQKLLHPRQALADHRKVHNNEAADVRQEESATKRRKRRHSYNSEENSTKLRVTGDQAYYYPIQEWVDDVQQTSQIPIQEVQPPELPRSAPIPIPPRPLPIQWNDYYDFYTNRNLPESSWMAGGTAPFPYTATEHHLHQPPVHAFVDSPHQDACRGPMQRHEPTCASSVSWLQYDPTQSDVEPFTWADNNHHQQSEEQIPTALMVDTLPSVLPKPH